jgi:DNA-binding CsgD family transcriptional regulator
VEVIRRIEAVCAAGLDDRSLREQVLVRIRQAIPFDGHVFALTDPTSRVASSPHADVPMLPWAQLPELIRWRYLTTVNRFDRMLGGPAASLRQVTGSPSESLVWKHVQRDLGIEDTAMVAFGDRYGAWGFLELWRTGTRFTLVELDLLTALVRPVTLGLREAVGRTFVDPGEQLGPVGPAVLVLDADLNLRTQTEAAGHALLQLLPPDEPMAPIPAAAYNAGAALIANEEGVPVGEPWARVHLGGSRWVTVKASRLGEDIAVSIEPSTPAERTDLVARAFALTLREREVLDLLCAGHDSRQIAGELYLSEHTVNDHAKSVLAKTSARTRQVLVSRALGGG